MKAELAGVPSVSIVTSGFYEMARAVAASLFDRQLDIVVYPGMILHDSPELLREKVDQHLAEPIAKGLLSR